MSDEVIVDGDHNFKAKSDKKIVNNETLTINHFQSAVVLRTLVQKCPMDKWCKQVLLLRIGRPWENIFPMTPLAISIQLGCTEKEVVEIEEAAKNILEDFINRSMDMALSKNFEKDVANKAFSQENTGKIII